MRPDIKYKDVLNYLCDLNQKELVELMENLDDWYAVERIHSAADVYLNENDEPYEETSEMSEEEEWKQIDDARRARELKSP